VSDPKVTAAHLRRAAAVYCRQSTLIQVERNRESTLRQYDLVSRAAALGWPRPAVRVIDADLGVSGSGLAARAGFTELTEQIALGQVGVVLALEVCRLARSSAEWYRLLDLCGITSTLIADEASVYHPGMFDDRLLLGLKGTMSEAELQLLRARMLGGLRNKAARGELRIPLPAGLVWGEAPGQILLHPDEAVRGAIGAVFDRFAACGVGPPGLAVAARERPKAALGQGRSADLGHGRLPGGAQDPDPSRLRGRLRLRPHPRRTLH
jgi:DNA invertase Pin-like site-specific DNA recombinase